MPRDAWVVKRDILSPDGAYAKIFDGIGAVPVLMNPDTTTNDKFMEMERIDIMHRIDPSQTPTMFKCATVSSAEIEQLRSLKQGIVRMGHVIQVEKEQIILEAGSMAIGPAGSTLCVDCSTDGLSTRPSVPVFNGEVITLQSVRTCQQVFSAALIGHLEARGGSDKAKNKLSKPTPHPDTIGDFMTMFAKDRGNNDAWGRDPELKKWLRRSRLNSGSHRPHLNVIVKTLWSNLHRVHTLIPLRSKL